MIVTPQGFCYRDHGIDSEVWRDVYEQNGYNLPSDMAGQVVVDIGANIGCFSFACLSRGCSDLFAYEPEPANFKLLSANCGKYPNGRVFNNAVWRSDKPVTELQFNRGMHAGAGYCSKTGELPVRTVSLDDVLAEATKGFTRSVDVLKLDCEGAEFPILYTSKRLDSVRLILGELHYFSWHEDSLLVADLPRPRDRQSFFSFLAENGFVLEHTRDLGVAVEFRAKREG